jgi:phosphate transport system protein
VSIRSAFDQELENLRDDILHLGSMVDTAMRLSMEALKERDPALARQIIADDEKINDLRFKIEEGCLGLLARQQPAARDLRFIVAAMHIALELERMADHASDDEVDQLYNQIFREMVSFMVEDPHTITRGMYLLFCAHNVERIADRVTNICERVAFMATGRMAEIPSAPEEEAC